MEVRGEVLDTSPSVLMKEKKPFFLFPEYVWMIFVGMLLALLILTNVFPAKAFTASSDSVIVFDFANMRYLKGTSDADGNVFHPGVSKFLALEESYNGVKWFSLPTNNYVNNFDSSALVSCILAPPSTWASEDHYSYHIVGASPFSIRDVAIPLVSDSRISDFDSGVYFEGGDGLIYAAFSDSSIYLKNKDQRGVSGVYYILPYVDSVVYVYQWVGSWTYLGSSSYSDTSLTDGIAVSTLLKGEFSWGDFEYDYILEPLYTDNYALYNGILPRLDVCSSSFVGSSDIPVDPDEPVNDQEFGVFVLNRDNYYLYLFHGSPVSFSSQPPVINGSPNNALSYAVSTYSLGTDFIQPVTFSSGGLFGNMRLFYIPCESVSDLYIYSLGTSVISYDIDYIKAYYSGSQSFDFKFDSSLGLLAFKVLNSSGSAVNMVNYYNLPSFYSAPSMGYNFSNDSLLVYSSSTVNITPLVTAYRYGLSGAALAPSPTPDPNVSPTPEPTPSATPIPSPGGTIIIVTPVPVTPTPFLDLNLPSPPGGDLDGDITDGVLSKGFEFIRNGGSSGLLSTAFSFVPDELQYLIWFLIFVLIILATLKIILHFGG